MEYCSTTQRKEVITVGHIIKSLPGKEELIIMSWTEQRNEMFQKIKIRLNALYERENIKDKECFKHKDGLYFRLFEFPGENALCVEYALDREDAILNRFEDGDRFYLDEMTEDEMLQSIIEEIEAG